MVSSDSPLCSNNLFFYRLRELVTHCVCVSEIMAPRRLAPSGSPTAEAKARPVARSASHLVYLIKGSARLVELHICQLADKPHLQPSQLVSLRAAMVGMQAAWDAVLPLCSPTQPVLVPPELHDAPPVGQVACWHGVHCWRPHCPYNHPCIRASSRQYNERAPGFQNASCVRPSAGAPAPAEAISAGASRMFSETSAASVYHGATSTAGTQSVTDPVADALQGEASCDNTPPASGGEVQTNVAAHVAGSSSDCTPPARAVADDTCGLDAFHDEEDPDLAEAIAMSLHASANTIGLPTSSAHGASDLHHQHEAEPAVIPRNPQRGVDAIQRPRQRARTGRRALGRVSVPLGPTVATSPLCGDCSPPASWRLHFGSYCCSRCRARVDVVFKP